MTPTGITLRAPRPADFDEFHALVSQWEVVRNLGSFPWPPEEEFTRQRCQPYTGDGFAWAICLSDRFVGGVAVTAGELGYMVHPEVQGRGIARYAISQALDHAFKDPIRLRLHADIWADNAVSRHLLRSFGFTLQVEEFGMSIARKVQTASETYVLERSVWMERK